MSAYQLGLAAPDLMDQVARLRQQFWGGTRADNLAYLKWRYLTNPYLTDPLIYLAFHEGRVVGMRAFYATSWMVHGLDEPQILPCGTDTGIAEEHRDKGLFAELTDFAIAGLIDRGFPYVINLSATPANLVTSVMTMGWRKVGSFEPLIRSTTSPSEVGAAVETGTAASTSNPLAQRLKRATWLRRLVRQTRTIQRNAFAGNPFSDFDAYLRRSTENASVAVTAEPRPRAMAKLAKRFDDPQRLHHVRDETFFSWRYRNPLATSRFSPYLVHRRFLFLGGSDARAYAVLQAHPGNHLVNLVDWAGDEGAFGELLDIAITGLESKRIGIWGATLPTAFRNRLGESAFEPDDQNPNARREGFIVKALLPTESAPWVMGDRRLLDMSSWDLRMIQSDAFM